MNADYVPPYADHWAVFLDVDGTLLELAEHPEAVHTGPELLDTLIALQAHAPIALISGRSIASLDALFNPLRLAAAGQHGAERRDSNGVVYRRDRLPGLSKLRSALESHLGTRPGIVLEDKGNTLAFHYRGAPELKQQIQSLINAEIQGDGDYHLICGNMVFEVREHGIDKGVTIVEFMGEEPFAGRVPVFIGDDTTDEDGFAKVNALGGHSVKVGAGATIARWRMQDVSAVRSWLAAYADWLITANRGERE